MGTGRAILSITLAISLSACGGGGSGGGSGGSLGGAGSGGGSSSCSLSARQDFVRNQLNEWYLFPTLLDTSVPKASHSSLQSYIDALVAPARAQDRDRYFTYVTSIAESEAFRNSGSNAGFGILLSYDGINRRVFVLDAYEGAPALGAGIDRGTEILAVGTSSTSLQTVSSLFASGGSGAVSNAFGPSDPGVTRVLQIEDVGGVVREVIVTKADYTLDPISNRFGAQIINDGGKRVGYIALRTFISPANNDLRAAFADFKAQGVTELIIDMRYNGGGDPVTADLFGDLMAANRVGQVFSYTTFRDSKSSNNETELFQAEANAIATTKVAFIGREGTASASELLINAFIPHLGNNMALIGTNTYGKPVGQIGLDNTACDDRLWSLAFKLENADRQGEYYTGLAGVVPNTCTASDDISKQFGDPTEDSVSTALDFLAGRSCTAISAARTTQGAAARRLLSSPAPSAAQQDLPGLF